MSDADLEKWNKIYADSGDALPRSPSQLLCQHIHLATLGRALDVACGSGRNALFMAAQGFVVDAIDISDVGLARARTQADAQNLPIAWYCQDLLVEDPRLPHDNYQLIILFRFVAPALLPRLIDHLAPGGLLVIEEHMHVPDELMSENISGPSSARFRVAPGELSAALQHLELLNCHEGLVEEGNGSRAVLSQVIGRKPG